VYRYVIAVVLVFYSTSVSARPQRKELVKIDLSGRAKVFQVMPGETSEVIFWGITKGNSSTPFSLQASIPGGATIEVFEQQLRGRRKRKKALKRFITRRKKSTEISLVSQAERLTAQQTCVSIAAGETGEDDQEKDAFPLDPNLIEGTLPSGLTCKDFSEEAIFALQQRLIAVFPPTAWTRQQTCEYIASPFYSLYGDLTDTVTSQLRIASQLNNTERVDLTGVVHKDACLSSRTNYLVQVHVGLTRVDSSLFPQGFPLTVKINEFPYDGSKASTIKPESDGMFAPEPLVLMTYLGFCGQKLSVAKWSHGKKVSLSSIRIEDLITHRGNLYTRSVIGSALTGGQATFELISGLRAYGVCFNLERRRQRVEGYQ
jgi:hypothetical protein